MIDIKQAKRDPANVFKTPKAVIEETSLDNKTKRDILLSWEQDEKLKQVAEEENMLDGNNSNLLNEIHEALLMLDPD